jgi:hypothetical protein
MSKNTPVFVRASIVTVIVLIVLAYVFFNTRLFIQGPQVTINSPISGISVDDDLIEIEGQVLNSSFIYINDRAISIDDSGNFKEQVLLLNGYNKIIIKAKDKFERQVTKELDLVYNRSIEI